MPRQNISNLFVLFPLHTWYFIIPQVLKATLYCIYEKVSQNVFTPKTPTITDSYKYLLQKLCTLILLIFPSIKFCDFRDFKKFTKFNTHKQKMVWNLNTQNLIPFSKNTTIRIFVLSPGTSWTVHQYTYWTSQVVF